MTAPVIELEGVSRTYHSAGVPVQALRSTDLRIDAGDFIAVMGPSGSGKSTLLHLLGCLDRPSAGRYLLEGLCVSTLGDRGLARVCPPRRGFELLRS